MFALRTDQVKCSADQQLAAPDRRAGNVGDFSGAGFEALQDLFHGFFTVVVRDPRTDAQCA